MHPRGEDEILGIFKVWFGVNCQIGSCKSLELRLMFGKFFQVGCGFEKIVLTTFLLLILKPFLRNSRYN